MDYKKIFSTLIALTLIVITQACSKTTKEAARVSKQAESRILEVDDSQAYKEIFASEKPVFIEFYATWCGPCKILAPRLEAVAEKLDSKVKFVKVNVENAPNLVEKYKIDSIPQMYFYSSKCTDEDPIYGVRSKAQITGFIEEKLKDCQ